MLENYVETCPLQAMAALKFSVVESRVTAGDRWFQWYTVLGKKEN
jgi:hypothetical protein